MTDYKQKLDEVLRELPVITPSRDLVAAAIDEAAPKQAKISRFNPFVVFAAAAAAAVILIVALPTDAPPPSQAALPTDAEITTRMASLSKRSRKVRSSIHTSTFKKESLTLSERMKRAKQKTKRSKDRISKEGEGYV